MRTRDQVSDDKLRGGFYSPDVLVDMCLKRASRLLEGRQHLRVLEPSAGDGAFLRGLKRTGMSERLAHVEAVEVIAEEAEKSAAVLTELGLPGRVRNENVLRWSQSEDEGYDLVLANPPYVRFQFISDIDKQLAKSISSRLGTSGTSVSNLWIPVFLLALSKLRPGGAFSIILPTEFLTGISAGSVRNWLLSNASDLTIDLFEPGSFPSVLQEVLVLSGRTADRGAGFTRTVEFFDHNGDTRTWTHSVSPGGGTWTNYLLSPTQNSAFEAARSITGVKRLSDVARFSVSTVTGANGYFCVDDRTVDEYKLREWAVPMLPRARNAEGLVFTKEEHQALVDNDQVAWLLSFSAERSDPLAHARPRAFLAEGTADGIDQRFKCRVRTPWYRVPVVPAGSLLLSKRSNRFPRVISNHAEVVTTDTIYRGQMNAGATVTADSFTATFHNSLTMLSAEIEGRSFGGGVLELVPSEVNALLVPAVAGAERELSGLDAVARAENDPEALIEATDKMLARLVPELDSTTLSALSEARQVLMARRLQRTHSKFYG